MATNPNIFDQMAAGPQAAPSPAPAAPAQGSATPQGNIFDSMAAGTYNSDPGASSNLPADVSARHARANAGKDVNYGEPEDAATTPSNVLQRVGEGVVRGAGDTATGLLSLAKKAGIPIPKSISNEKGSGILDSLDTEARNIPERIGKGIEGVAEFIGGDEALKSLSIAEKLGLAAKVAEVAKKSPRLAQLLDMGLSSVREGVTSGGETMAKGGTDKQIVENTLLGAGTSMAARGIGAVGKEMFIKPSPVPKVAGVLENATPFDDSTIQNVAKDLGPEERATLQQHAGDTIPQGSTTTNHLVKAVKPVFQTIQDRGAELNDLVSKAAPMTSDTMGAVQSDLAALQARVPVSMRPAFKEQMTEELENAKSDLLSTDAKDILSRKRILDSGIKDYTAPEGPLDTPGKIKAGIQVTMRRALSNKLGTEIPETAPINKELGNNLGVRSFLRSKLGAVADEPNAAEMRYSTELGKGNAHLDYQARVRQVDENIKVLKQVVTFLGLGALGEGAVKHLLP